MSSQGTQPHTHPAHSRWSITNTVWAITEKDPTSHTSLSSKHIVPHVLKHVSGTYFMPSTEYGSGKGHKDKRGSRACAWEKAESALHWDFVLTCVSCLPRPWFWDSSWASFLLFFVLSPGLHMLFHFGSFLIQILRGWLILLFKVPSQGHPKQAFCGTLCRLVLLMLPVLESMAEHRPLPMCDYLQGEMK